MGDFNQRLLLRSWLRHYILRPYLLSLVSIPTAHIIALRFPFISRPFFRFDSPDEKPGYDYSRSGNPTREALETTLAQLEGGAGAVCVGSGMAAVATVLALYDAGSHIICSHDCYGGTERLLTWYERQGKLSVSYVDLTLKGNLEAAIRPETKAIWVETPSNPLLRITDLEAVGELTGQLDIDFIVDNTFLSPLLQQPFQFGADFIIHSTTKYLNGHSDVVGGVVVARTEEGTRTRPLCRKFYGCHGRTV